jgi:hypothetical protein
MDCREQVYLNDWLEFSDFFLKHIFMLGKKCSVQVVGFLSILYMGERTTFVLILVT